jgi:alpha-ribazole phosphatase
MSRALFIRHAETEMAGRYCGHSNPDLNAQGRAQLAKLAHLLCAEPFDTVYSSDLRRASSTAQAITAGRKIPQVLRPALREIDFGDWEGMSWEQIEQLDPEYAREWIAAFPNLPARTQSRSDRGGHACRCVARGFTASVRMLGAGGMATNPAILLHCAL